MIKKLVLIVLSSILLVTNAAAAAKPEWMAQSQALSAQLNALKSSEANFQCVSKLYMAAMQSEVVTYSLQSETYSQANDMLKNCITTLEDTEKFACKKASEIAQAKVKAQNLLSQMPKS